MAVAQRGHSRKGGSQTSRGGTRRGRSASIQPYAEIINRYAAQFKVDPALVAAVMKCESDGNPTCRSSAGAMGLMQLMPGTCRDFGVIDPYDPEQNIAGGTALLGRNLRRYHGDMTKAVAAYNAGPRHADDGSWMQMSETRRYVPAVLARFDEFRSEGWAINSDGYDTEPSNPEPSNPIPAPAPVVVVPEPVSRINPTDMMFEVVRSTQSAIEASAIGENGILDDAAADALSSFQNGSADESQLQSGVEQFLANARFNQTSVKVFSFTSSSVSGFSTLWSQQPRTPGRFVGFAHGVNGRTHQWIVIVAVK